MNRPAISASEPGSGSHLRVTFLPSWDFLGPLREYVEVCAKQGRVSPERSGIVAQELLENAVKYGTPSEPVELTVRMVTSSLLEILVANRAHPSRVALLTREYERIGSDEPTAAFAKAIERLRHLPQGSSMLGLARIANEAELKLQVEDDRVTILARIQEKPSSVVRRSPT